MNKLEKTLSVLLLLFMIYGLVASKKYLQLRDAYHKAESDKVMFCKENQQLKCELIEAYNEAEKLFELGLKQ
jgi:hypothetical protein